MEPVVERIVRLIEDEAAQAKSLHRDLNRMGNKWKACEAEGAAMALRRVAKLIRDRELAASDNG